MRSDFPPPRSLAAMPKTAFRVLFLTYEFTWSPFSGNGMLSRSIAKALLRGGCEVRVVCARPAEGLDGISADNPIGPPEVSDAQAADIGRLPSSEYAQFDRSHAPSSPQHGSQPGGRGRRPPLLPEVAPGRCSGGFGNVRDSFGKRSEWERFRTP